MKITDISIDQLLYTKPVNSRPYDSAEEPGFFKKMFAKKEPEKPFFNKSRRVRQGRIIRRHKRRL